jgi:hypothetical protein
MPMGEDGEFEQGDGRDDPFSQDETKPDIREVWRHIAIRRHFLVQHDWACPPNCQYGEQRG